MSKKKSEKEEEVEDVYYNPRKGFLSLNKFYQRIKDEGIKISFNDLKKIIEQQTPYQLNRQVKKPKEFSTIYSPSPLSSTQADVMIYDRYQIHSYKYILGVIDVTSRYACCRALTNMRVSTLLSSFKDIFKEFSEALGSKKILYPHNINFDNQFGAKQIVEYFTKQGTKLWLSEPEQIHKNAIIERFFRTLALLFQRARTGTKNFDWPKALPDIIYNYNTTIHTTLKSTPLKVLKGEAVNPVEPRMIESNIDKGDRVRIKHKKSIYDKGDVETHSRDIYLIVEKKGKKNKLKNLNTGDVLKRLYHDDEITQTFNYPEQKEKVEKKKLEKPKLNEEETIAVRREKREKKPSKWVSM
jgi:hypothetical protein